MKNIEEFEIEVYAETCCEDCNEIIHNHIDCPLCKKQYAKTNQYCDLQYEETVQCENCDSIFEKISESWYYNCIVKTIKEK